MSLPVRDVRWLASSGRWHGRVQFPDRRHPTEILLFPLASGLTGVRARCPHEGQDLSEATLDDEGRLVCPRHGMLIGVAGTPCAGFRVEGDAERFHVPWPLVSAATS